jgi:hypothetical protein
VSDPQGVTAFTESLERRGGESELGPLEYGVGLFFPSYHNYDQPVSVSHRDLFKSTIRRMVKLSGDGWLVVNVRSSLCMLLGKTLFRRLEKIQGRSFLIKVEER